MSGGVKQILLALLVVLVGIGVVAGVYLWMSGNDSLSIDSDSKKYKANIQRPEDWGENRIAVPGYGDIQMEENTDIFHVALYNPKENPCYFVFHVIIEGKELYTSGLVPPGEAITSSKLSEKISKGTHIVTIKIDTYDLADKKTPMNGSEVKTKIITYSK